MISLQKAKATTMSIFSEVDKSKDKVEACPKHILVTKSSHGFDRFDF